jgi:hypothetical protein
LNKFFVISVLLIISFIFSACEKVIEISLADSKPVIVIEATVTNGKEPFTVLISKTSPYFGTSTKELVSGAKVSLRTDNGKPKYFTEQSPGIYKMEKVTAFVNNWYNVDVEYNGITYSARSYLHAMVPIVDVTISHFDGLGFFDSGYKINCFIRDPVNIDNFYRIKLLIDGMAVNNDGEIDLYSDKLFDGKVIGLVQHSAMVFQDTDVVTVELQAIDQAAYDYFSTLENITGIEMIQSASPANPISNFSNGALGYFSAYSVDRKTVVIKDYLKK